VLVGISLGFAVTVLVAAAASMWVAAWRLATPAVRSRLRSRIAAGVKAGVVATAAYDACRYGVVSALAFSFEPFHVWSLYGRLFVGASTSEPVAFAAGAAYHLANGIGFALAFALVFRRPTWKLGIVWGIGLELAMAGLYPAWLRIAALGEFLTVSAVGHVVYGAVMGAGVQRLLGRSQKTRPEVSVGTG